MLNPWPWLALILVVLISTVVVQRFEISSADSKLETADASLKTATANQLANGKSAAAWEAEATAANARTASCQLEQETNRQANAVAYANAQKLAATAQSKLDSYNARLNKAKTGSCAALLSTPICAEALPQ